jgi:hypothetical protein
MYHSEYFYCERGDILLNAVSSSAFIQALMMARIITETYTCELLIPWGCHILKKFYRNLKSISDLRKCNAYLN